MLVCNSQRIYPVPLPSPPRRSRSGLAALRHLQKDLYSLLGTLTSEPLYCTLTFFDSALMNMFYITSVPLSDWLTCDPTSTTVMLVLKVISGMSFLWLPLYCKLQALLFALLVLENNICGFCGFFFSFNLRIRWQFISLYDTQKPQIILHIYRNQNCICPFAAVSSVYNNICIYKSYFMSKLTKQIP